MRPEPPPLEPGSDAARLLHRVWSDRPVVQILHWSEQTATGEPPWEWFAELATIVASHTALRLGYRVLVLAAERHEDLADILKAATTPEIAAIFDENTALRSKIVVVTPDRVDRYPSALDVRPDVIIGSGAELDAHPEFASIALTGHQLVIAGWSEQMDKVARGPQHELPPVPLDIEIAGAPD